MTPLEVRDYLSTRGRAPLSDIAAHFGSAPDAVRDVLDLWMRKGKVRRLEGAGDCGRRGSGCSCSKPPPEVFEWTA